MIFIAAILMNIMLVMLTIYFACKPHVLRSFFKSLITIDLIVSAMVCVIVVDIPAAVNHTNIKETSVRFYYDSRREKSFTAIDSDNVKYWGSDEAHSLNKTYVKKHIAVECRITYLPTTKYILKIEEKMKQNPNIQSEGNLKYTYITVYSYSKILLMLSAGFIIFALVGFIKVFS